jgi:hypothetical protein
MMLEAWLTELKIPQDNHRLVMLLPMVYVAWADGQIHARERRLILQIAEERGLLENGGRETLERWLSVAPTESQLRTNLALLNSLCSSDGHGTDEFDADCAQTLIAYCQDVADAAGGMLGLTSARSEAEQSALKRIAAALDMHQAKNWRARLS